VKDGNWDGSIEGISVGYELIVGSIDGIEVGFCEG